MCEKKRKMREMRSEKQVDIWGMHGYFWRCSNVRDKCAAGDGGGKCR